MTMFSELFICIISVRILTMSHLKGKKYSMSLKVYKMNIRTNLLGEYVNFVDKIKKRNTKLWICTIILFILIIIVVICYLNEYSFIK